MHHWLDIYYTHIKTALAVQFQYRVAYGVWMIGRVLEPLIYLAVWSTVAQSTSGPVGGYNIRDFAAYYLALLVVNQLTFTWMLDVFGYQVRQGTLSAPLLLPIHPLHNEIATVVANKIMTSIVVIPLVIGLSYLFNPALSPTLWTVLSFMVAVVLAFLLRLLLEATLALLAFWLTQVEAINQTYFMLALLLSGRLAPLALLPGSIQNVANMLPFRWTVAFPIEVLLGWLTPSDIGLGLMAQGTWVLVMLMLFKAVWRMGVRRYSAVGA